MLETARRQAAQGCDVAVAGGLIGDASQPTIESVQFFNLDIPDYSGVKMWQMPSAAAGVVWSDKSRRSVVRVVQDFQPDIVHLHNYAHQLSSSIVYAFGHLNVPVVYTAHDYKLICPAYTANDNDGDCFECREAISSKLLRERCLHDSLAWSATVAVEARLTRRKFLIPRTLIAPSRFMANALKSSWLGPLCDIRLVRNPAEAAEKDWHGDGGYILYVGRLSEEKGVEQLARAANELKRRLVVAGDGPERQRLESRNLEFVEYVGHVDSDRLRVLRRHCAAQVVPSVWPENAPLAALEAAGQGVPLLLTPRGGLVELAELGAVVSYMKEPTTEALGVALAELEGSTHQGQSLDPQLSWAIHLDLLKSVYTSAIADSRS